MFDLGTPLPLSVSNAGPEGLHSPKSVHPRATGIVHRIRSVANPPPPLLALLLPRAQRCVQVNIVHVRCGWGSAGPLPLVAPPPLFWWVKQWIVVCGTWQATWRWGGAIKAERVCRGPKGRGGVA